jgi:hypothetical protein
MLKPLVAFHGAVAVQRQSAGALGLTLIGAAGEGPAEPTSLAFSGKAPEGLPEALADLKVVAAGATRYLLESAAREWPLQAAAAHLHHDVGTAFCRALPPRRVPLAKRCLWALVLTLAASRSGLAVLAALRRQGK